MNSDHVNHTERYLQKTADPQKKKRNDASFQVGFPSRFDREMIFFVFRRGLAED
jgi:hypothetical protein